MRNKYELDHYKDNLYYPKVKLWWWYRFKYMRRMSPKTIWLQKDKNILRPTTYEECVDIIDQYKNSLFISKKKIFGVILVLALSYTVYLGIVQTEYTGQENKYLFSFYLMLANGLILGAVWLFSRLIEWCFTE